DDCPRFPLRPLRAPRGPSSSFCPPLSTVRRQIRWRSWRTRGQSNTILSAYDRLCPDLAAGGRQNKQRSWRTRALFVRRWPARGSWPTAARSAPWCSTVGYSARSARDTAAANALGGGLFQGFASAHPVFPQVPVNKRLTTLSPPPSFLVANGAVIP